MQPLRTEGKVRRVKHNGLGDADGAVLENGTVLQFPPHAGKQFAALLVEGSTLCASDRRTLANFAASVSFVR